MSITTGVSCSQNACVEDMPINFARFHDTRFASLARRIGFSLARIGSAEFKAFTDVFYPEYEKRMNWQSGLGEVRFVLYSIARAIKPEVVVEIGSARGKSTCMLALACKQNRRGKVYAVDPHTPNSWTDVGVHDSSYNFLIDRLRDYDLESWCEVIPATAGEVAKTWSKNIDLFFIDGDHTYEGVKHDFETFQPWFSATCLVMFHDTTWEYVRDDEYYRKDMGVPRFMSELQQKGYHSATIGAHPGLTVLHPLKGGFPFFPVDYAKAVGD